MFIKLFINFFTIYYAVVLYPQLSNIVENILGEANVMWSVPIFFILIISLSLMIWLGDWSKII